MTKYVDFRIFIDAATLKRSDVMRLGRDDGADFRIFIDAATLKRSCRKKYNMEIYIFPHLYRCGHIEANDNPGATGSLEAISASL